MKPKSLGFLFVKLLWVSFFSLLSLSTVASAAVLDHYSSKGEFADLRYYSPCSPCSGITFMWLYVSKIGHPPNEETLLTYYYTSTTGSGNGSGKIPNDDFRGGVLSTDLSRLDQISGGALGAIDITFTKVTNVQSGLSTGVQEYEYEGVMMRSTGTSNFTSARATGTIGSVHVDTYGSIGTNQNNTITIERKLPPLQ